MVEISDLADMEVTVSTERLPVLPHEPRNSYVDLPSSSSSSGSDRVRSNSKSKFGTGSNSEVRFPPSQEKFRKRQAKKEILRRALTPPVKRPTLRWLDFRPTPSRLRVMSSE